MPYEVREQDVIEYGGKLFRVHAHFSSTDRVMLVSVEEKYGEYVDIPCVPKTIERVFVEQDPEVRLVSRPSSD